MKTRSISEKEITRRWIEVDAEGQTLGRLATEIARVLSGKNKPFFSPNLDCGDYVVVINAEKIRVTGKKLEKKIYYRHTAYPGGLRSDNLAKVIRTFPTRVIERAVRGMLPKGTLGEAMYKKLKVYSGPNHPHSAQVGQLATEK